MNTSLNKRIPLAMMLVATSVMTVFALIVGIASDKVEDQLLDQLVRQEYEDTRKRLSEDPNTVLSDAGSDPSWLTRADDRDGLPIEFGRLPLGMHPEVLYEGAEYQVMRDNFNDKILTVAYNITLLEAREQTLIYVLLSSVLLAPILVMVLSYLLANRLTRPVSQLAAELQELDPASDTASLSSIFRGQEVEAIANAFDRYQERIDLLMEREKAFSATASHELRTPLAVIGACTDVLQDIDELPEPARAQISRVAKSVRTMTDLVNSLLALAHEQRPPLSAPLQMHPILDEVIASHRMQTQGHDVALTLSCHPNLSLWLPAGDIVILANNLIQNAVRNTRAGVVHTSCDAERLVVTDSGRGIPSDIVENIFDKHVQSHDSSGIGLGLHIVKRLCELHGWDIRVESALGKGTAVTVVWNLQAREG